MSSRSIAPRRPGLFVPLFHALSDPATVAGLAADAEVAGWDGVFVWDHVRWRDPLVDLEHPDRIAQIVADLTELRRQIGRDLAEPYDVIAALPPRRTRSPTRRRVARGGWWSSHGMRCRSTRYAA